jgi:hypothetical protein
MKKPLKGFFFDEKKIKYLKKHLHYKNRYDNIIPLRGPIAQLVRASGS